MKSWKAHFAGSIGVPGAPLHFAAHSHHPWPDVTRTAHAEAWNVAARLLDDKWGYVFGELIPEAQRHVAGVLNLPDPATLAFAPSTHEFLGRLLSSLEPGRTHRILTTDGEFHSFSRQAARLEEDGLVEVKRIAVEPFANFPERFCEAAQAGGWDMVYVSQVFFNSGYGTDDLNALIASVPDDDAVIVIDGYHGFCARPTDLSAVAARIFYLGGGYKYAMAGEGCCFMHSPSGYVERPRDTGWFAAFGALQDKQTGVPYAAGGQRMMGATFDATALYRLNAVMRWMDAQGLSVAAADAHCTELQLAFLSQLGDGGALADARLVLDPREMTPARFLTFETASAAQIYDGLRARNVLLDRRADRLRFGFGVYQDLDDVAQLVAHLHAKG